MKRRPAMIASLFFISCFCLASCAKGGSYGKKAVVGLSFSDFNAQRWVDTRNEMAALLEKGGCAVVSQEANHDAKLQNDQIIDMAKKGAKVIVIVAEDSAAAVSAVEYASKRGTKVIAFDRPIYSPSVAAYVGFDPIQVGREQAKGILGLRPSGRFVLLGGAPTDRWAQLFRIGQMQVLKPAIDSGRVSIAADQWAENWDPMNARTLMKNVITATKGSFQAVVASNDLTALGALEALREAGMAGRVAVSGQDASAEGVASILHGGLSFTILKDTRLLPPLAASLALDFIKGEKPAGLVDAKLSIWTGEKSAEGSLPCAFAPLKRVDKGNLEASVIQSGWQKREDIGRAESVWGYSAADEPRASAEIAGEAEGRGDEDVGFTDEGLGGTGGLDFANDGD